MERHAIVIGERSQSRIAVTHSRDSAKKMAQGGRVESIIKSLNRAEYLMQMGSKNEIREAIYELISARDNIDGMLEILDV